jgi:hypothetical protein
MGRKITQQFTIHKGGETYIFDIRRGDESDVMKVAKEWRYNPEINFDALDYIMLKCKLGLACEPEIDGGPLVWY